MAEIVVFSIVGSVIYVYTGNEYMTAPAFGSLSDLYKQISFSFMVPTIIFLGCLYASVTGRFVFFRVFRGSRHVGEHTVFGWFAWAGILLVTWIMAFIVSQVIPFFSSRKLSLEGAGVDFKVKIPDCANPYFVTVLSVMCSVFDCWFGFIFWGVAYFRMRRADQSAGIHRKGMLDVLSMGLNVVIIIIGIFFLTVGTYASVQGIVDAFNDDNVKGIFSCERNAI